MCPFSGIVQYFILLALLLICHAALIIKAAKISFTPKNVSMYMYDSIQVDYDITSEDHNELYTLYSTNREVASISNNAVLVTNYKQGTFNITGNFLGQALIGCKDSKANELEGDLKVIVTRKKRTIDTVFTASVATLVSIIYINFGCALNWSELKQTLKRPIGPAIGVVGQFIFMPLLSFFLGKLLFPDNHEMQLGMFFTGISPGGGASNVWTAVLDGNIDLSITMTTISTFGAFVMMPLWLVTLGKTIFDNGKLETPYSHIMTYAIALVVPLAIGYLISRYLKSVAQFMTRILKGFSSLLILFIITFAIVANLYLFQLLSWRIMIAGLGLPFLGYISAFALAKIMKQKTPDALTIAIETGIQNTGIAIFLLRFSLPQPQADLTTVCPVAVAMMTPIPLMCIYIYKKIRSKYVVELSK